MVYVVIRGIDKEIGNGKTLGTICCYEEIESLRGGLTAWTMESGVMVDSHFP